MGPSNLSPADLQLLQELAAMAPPSQANFTPPALLDPHYVPPSRGGAIIGVSVATTALALISVCLRIFARATEKKTGLGLDDYTIVFAVSLAIAQCVYSVLDVVKAGAGHHSYDTTLHQQINQLLYGFILVQLYNTVATVTKLSVLLFIRRLFVRTNLWNRVFYFLNAFFGALWAASFFTTFFQCTPAAVGWDLRVFAANKGGHCPNVVAHGYFFSAMFSITDVVLLLLPIFAVSKLQLKPISKFGVMFLFSLGALSCIFCIWKSFYLRSVVHSTDVSWALGRVLILAALEINIGIIVTSLPALTSLSRRIISTTRISKRYPPAQDTNRQRSNDTGNASSRSQSLYKDPSKGVHGILADELDEFPRSNDTWAEEASTGRSDSELVQEQHEKLPHGNNDWADTGHVV